MKNIKKMTTYIIPLFLLILLSISLILMYHSKFISPLFVNNFEKQLTWIIIGLGIFVVCYFIPSKVWFRFSFIMYLVNVLLLLLVLIYGNNANGAKAWLKFGNFQFQPSEFMKFSYSLFLAIFCSNRIFYTLKDEFKFLFQVLLLFLIPSILIFLEPDTGAIIFLLLITIVLLWNTKISKKWFWIFLFIIASILGGFFYCYFWQRDFLIKILGTSFFYRVERVLNFGSGMQIENALIALGSAPFWKFSLTTPGIYIPEAPTDFIFALSSNVFGLTGPLLIIFSYFCLDLCLINYLHQEKNTTRSFFILAFLTIFFFSQFINIGMNLGILPIIGIPLPFLSYGGSIMIASFAFLGIIAQQKKSFTKKRKAYKLTYR